MIDPSGFADIPAYCLQYYYYGCPNYQFYIDSQRANALVRSVNIANFFSQTTISAKNGNAPNFTVTKTPNVTAVLIGSGTAEVVGAVAGATAATSLAVACDGATGGTCIVANAGIVGGGAVANPPKFPVSSETAHGP
jgi:hypothetical protein